MPGLETSRSDREGATRVLLTVACVIIVVAGLKAGAEIFIPVALGLFLGVLSLPMLNFLSHKCRIPRFLAIILTILIDLLILGAIVYVVSGVIPEFQDKRLEYAEKLRTQASHFSETMDSYLQKFESLGNSVGFESEDSEKTIPTFKEMFNRYWDTNRIVGLIGQTDLVERFTSVASKVFFVLILMVFVLAESQQYEEKFRDVIRQRGPNLRRFQNSSRDIQNYLLLKTAVSALTGLLAWVVCAVMEIDFPVLWGLLAFVLNFIPVIGSFLAGIPPVALALILQGFWPAMIVLILYLAINAAIGNFLEPMLLGDRFGLSTIVVILSVLFWGYVWGAAGMFLAVPLTMMVKVMLDNTADLRWISVLISKGEVERRKRLQRWQRVRKNAQRENRKNTTQKMVEPETVDGRGELS